MSFFQQPVCLGSLSKREGALHLNLQPARGSELREPTQLNSVRTHKNVPTTLPKNSVRFVGHR